MVVALTMVLSLPPALHAAQPGAANPQPTALAAAQFRGTHGAVKFDVSPPLRLIPPKPIAVEEQRGGAMVDPDGGLGKPPLVLQQFDGAAQTTLPLMRIPGASVSFDGPNNLSGVAPPDPAGDVGPDHYVAMSNLFFQIYNKSGASVFGPAANNTLWSNFGGACEAENAGDPIVLYDQFADRWLLTQFTAAGPTYFNCVALSMTSDPTGQYYRWAFTTGPNFPDYPKYGVWTNAYVISTREFSGGSYVGVGAYAVDRSAMLAGNPNPTVVDFFVDRSVPRLIGDGLLPADIDGPDLPPSGAPAYMLGSQDDGGPYSAPTDALLLWRFVIDFATPANSSFLLTHTLPIAPFDTIFGPCSGRSCIPQPNTSAGLDILSYRQRPLHRLAYRNFGTHESLVTNQSVEGAPGIAGVRWWEVRDPSGTPTVFQEGTFAPGASDGVHRWMASAAMDGDGNIALGYSVSSASVFPGVRYTGRLVSDPLGTMGQGEGVIINGTGSQTGGGSRWGDYTSLNVDPIDDCTFWHVNQYLPTTSGNGWRLRVGAFRFDECGEPGFVFNAVNAEQSICVGSDAVYSLNVAGFGGFAGEVALSASGHPAGTSTSFVPNPVTSVPASSTLTISNTGAAAAGAYSIMVTGTSAGAAPRNRTLALNVFATSPAAPALTLPANAAINVGTRPSFAWSGSNTEAWRIEVATDPAFNTIVFTSTINSTTTSPSAALASNTLHYWRVVPANTCGTGIPSQVFTFTTAPAPGDCNTGVQLNTEYSYGFEDGAGGWTSSGTGNSWAQSNQRANSGTFSWKAVDPTVVSDQRLVSPPMVLPGGQLPLTLQFFQYRDIEENGATACWDAGVIESSIDAGATWVPITSQAILEEPYTGLISNSANPLQGRQGWCNLKPFARTIVDIASLAGQTAQFRFRLGSDASVGAEGWYIDDVRVQSCGRGLSVFRNGFE